MNFGKSFFMPLEIIPKFELALNNYKESGFGQCIKLKHSLLKMMIFLPLYILYGKFKQTLNLSDYNFLTMGALRKSMSFS